MAREALLADTLVKLADSLVDDFDVVELLTLLATRCVEVLDVSAAGLMLIGPDGEPKVIASSSETMRVLELFELQAEEGPCLDCLESGEPVLQGSLNGAGGQRWPRFAPKARAEGFRFASAIPMRLRGTVIGALNVFGEDQEVMSAEDAVIAQAFADVATIAILQHRAASEARLLNEQLNHALSSRIAIEQAKGVIAERAGLEMVEAFERLRAYARGHNLRLADVAKAVVDGELGEDVFGAAG